jgi:hypothetical protein
MKTLVLTNEEARYLLKIIGKTKMDKYYSVYEKLKDIIGIEDD